MSDLGTIVREHYESIAPPVDIEGLTDRLATEQPAPRYTRSRGPLVAVAAALVVLLLIGGVTLLIQLYPAEETPVIEEPVTTTVAPDEAAPPEPPNNPTTEVDLRLPFTVLDSEGNVGTGATLLLDSDGIPLIVYGAQASSDAEPAEIRIARCVDATCTQAATVMPLATVGEERWIGQITAIMPLDGLPLIIWLETVEGEDPTGWVRTYKCTDPTCSRGTTAELTGVGDWNLTAAAGSDGLPVIVAAWGEGVIKVTSCSDPACKTGAETSVLEIPGEAFSAVVDITSDNLPVVAFAQMKSTDQPPVLTLARCSDSACRQQPTVIDLGITVHSVGSLDLDSAGNPMMVASGPAPDVEGEEESLLVTCTDPACTAAPVVTELSQSLPDGEAGGEFGAIHLTPNGSITAVQQRAGGLRIITCADPTCSGGPTDIEVLPGLGYQETDVAIGPDGNPVIAIHARTDLGVLICEEPTCASSRVEPLSSTPPPEWQVTNVAPREVQMSGANPPVEIGPDGNLVIAYLGLTDQNGPEGEWIAVPMVRFCADPACTESTSVPFPDGAGWPGMVLLPDGTPVVAYSTWNDQSELLYISWCADPACTTFETEQVAEAWLASPTAMAANDEGSVAMAYQDINDYHVYMVQCRGGSCANATPVKIGSLVDGDGSEGGMRWYTNSIDLVLLPDGRPVMAVAQANNELRYVECLDQECSESTMTVIDDSTEGNATVEISPEGLPIIAYYDDGSLRVAACRDLSCVDVDRSSLGDAEPGFIASVTPSLAHGSDGFPIIAYWAPRALVLANCHDAACTDADVDLFANVRTYALTTLLDGSPLMAYFVRSEQGPDPGQEEFGWPTDLLVAVCAADDCRD